MGSTRSAKGSWAAEPAAASTPLTLLSTKSVYFTTARMPKLSSMHPRAHRQRTFLSAALRALRCSLSSSSRCSLSQASCRAWRLPIFRAASQVVTAVTPMYTRQYHPAKK